MHIQTDNDDKWGGVGVGGGENISFFEHGNFWGRREHCQNVKALL